MLGLTNMYTRNIGAGVKIASVCQHLSIFAVHIHSMTAIPTLNLVSLQRRAGNKVVGVVGALL